MELQLKAPTISDLLSLHAGERGDKTAYTFLESGSDQPVSLTYRELDTQARAVAARLQRSLSRGDRALILTTDNRQFIRAFLACQHAGIIAVPVAPPWPLRSERRVHTLRAVAKDSGARAVLTGGGADMRTPLAGIAPELDRLEWIHVDEIEPGEANAYRKAPVISDDLAFIQYTSGSTATPKGVTVSHRSLLLNEDNFSRCMGLTEADTLVSWLPLFHDLGLIGKVLQNLYLGSHLVLMPNLDFVQRPVRWLRAITEYRGTVSGAPNFAYDMCVRRIPPQQRAEFDLSSWKLAFSGAEPVRPATLDAFAEAFAPCGFERKALYPAYGLAEATLIATGSVRDEGPSILEVDLEAMRKGELVPGGDHKLVGVGKARYGRGVLIVDPETTEPLPEGRIGEVWLTGPDIATGYWQRPEETERTFRARPAGDHEFDGPYLRTGDLGVLYEGELYITGRAKDLIIVGGRNHDPQEIELTVYDVHPWLRRDCCAAFSVDRDGREQVVIVAEFVWPEDAAKAGRPGDPPPSLTGVKRLIKAAVSEEHGIQVDDIQLVLPGSVPKTSSGKIQRSACRVAYENGALQLAADPSARALEGAR